MKGAWLISRTVLVEATRRKEIYAIVVISLGLIGVIMTVNFFKLEGLAKFYREASLQVMSIATALTVIVLAARQLPREFESRTIYPLLAKPISRFQFLLGKILGVMLSALFCYGMFMAVFVAGSLYLGSQLHFGLLAQFICLQMMQMLILASLCFWLSLVLNLDAAITIGVIFYAMSASITTATSYLYDTATQAGKAGLIALTYILPQLTLFDLSGKCVHAEAWGPIPAGVLLKVMAYGFFYVALYVGCALFVFRRKPL